MTFEDYQFQFTHPRGVRRAFMAFAASLLVSIHAPARGATNNPATHRKSGAGFNSRTREGCDAQKTSA